MKHLAFALLLILTSSCGLLRPKPPVYPAVELEGGLIVQDLVVPEAGLEAAYGDFVTIDYTIELAADGTVADSSLERGLPFAFRLEPAAVFPGLAQGLLGMRLLARRKIFVPAALAYGSDGLPPRIPPHADLWLEVELMDIVRESGGAP